MNTLFLEQRMRDAWSNEQAARDRARLEHEQEQQRQNEQTIAEHLDRALPFWQTRLSTELLGLIDRDQCLHLSDKGKKCLSLPLSYADLTIWACTSDDPDRCEIEYHRSSRYYSYQDAEQEILKIFGWYLTTLFPQDEIANDAEPTPAPQPSAPEPTPLMDTVDAVLASVRCEIDRARRKHKPFNSLHETYAVILEEMEEFWDEVRRTQNGSTMPHDARNELIQIAAMAVSAVVDIPANEVADADDD